jgi:hypothetical protein
MRSISVSLVLFSLFIAFATMATTPSLTATRPRQPTAPEPTVPAPVRERLHADGFDVSSFIPQLYRATDGDDVALVVSFDDDDAIVRQVDALINALARSGSR